jgi:glycosyltransferase involved in cell wall biosynthesis
MNIARFVEQAGERSGLHIMRAKTLVGMNLLWSVPGVGGSEDYLLRQLMGLAESDHDYDVTVFAPRGFSERHPWLSDHHRVVEAPSTCAKREVRIALEHTWLPVVSRHMSLMHHGGGSLPRTETVPSVLTIHDVQWTDYPEYVSPRKLAYLKRIVPSSLRRADHIAVPSQFVASTLTEHFTVSEQKISVVRHGLEPRFVSEASSEADLRSRFDLGARRVVAFPAITHPHKNHRFLLELLAGEGDFADPELVLVCTGGEGRAEESVRAMAETLGVVDRVKFLGRVSAADRNGLVKLSEAMVFPSEYEGFGAPVIEAMLLGVPVVCSDRASLPEVAGDAAVVVPLNAGEWSSALTRVAAHRDHIVTAGRARAAQFTTALSAGELIACYDKVLAHVDRGMSRRRKRSR